MESEVCAIFWLLVKVLFPESLWDLISWVHSAGTNSFSIVSQDGARKLIVGLQMETITNVNPGELFIKANVRKRMRYFRGQYLIILQVWQWKSCFPLTELQRDLRLLHPLMESGRFFLVFSAGEFHLQHWVQPAGLPPQRFTLSSGSSGSSSWLHNHRNAAGVQNAAFTCTSWVAVEPIPAVSGRGRDSTPDKCAPTLCTTSSLESTTTRPPVVAICQIRKRSRKWQWNVESATEPIRDVYYVYMFRIFPNAPMQMYFFFLSWQMSILQIDGEDIEYIKKLFVTLLIQRVQFTVLYWNLANSLQPWCYRGASGF